jgi:phosphatidate cytidylyltransferase
MTRIATALVLLPVLWGVSRLAPFPVFAGVFAAGIAVACWEALRLCEARGTRPFKALGVVSCLAVSATFALADDPGVLLAVLLAVFVAGLAVGMARRDTADAIWESAVGTFVPVFFVGFGLSHLIGLRAFGGERGADLLFLLFLCVMSADTLAYYVGRSVGRHRIAPLISPKKTWEGAFAGLAGSVLGAFVARIWFFSELPAAHAALLGAVLFAAGFLGDLAESVLKRAAGRKDSSSLLPGHGGLLDRADSLILAAPALYQYTRWFLVDLP